LAVELGQRIVYIATAEVEDAEMAERIAAHRLVRPTTWQTLEAPRHVGAALAEITEAPDGLLLDCLTLLVSNILLALETEPPTSIEAAVRAELEGILAAQARLDVPLLVVSNEVGLGLVPPYPLGRVYRDVLGRANQYLAAQANRVIFMVAGLPMTIKG
jgi:adenosylcobinamide kinase/adenosylcobinamide-phosphate guanylyltransferase